MIWPQKETKDGTPNLELKLNLPNVWNLSTHDARGIVDAYALLPQPITGQMPKRC